MSKRYQALKPKDRTFQVDVFPLLVMDHLEIERLDAGERDSIQGILDRQPNPTLRNLTSGRSFNAPQVIAATMLLCGDRRQHEVAREFMLMLNSYQLGDQAPPPGFEILGFHGGPEQLGEYWPWRWWCDAVMILAGVERKDPELVECGRRALAVHAALADLISVPEEETGGLWDNAKGQRILSGEVRFPLLAAERLNMGHVNGQEVAMLLAETTGKRYTWKRPELFSSVLITRHATRLRDSLGRVGYENPLKGIKLRSRMNLIHWAQYSLAYLEEAFNHNTAGMLAVGFDRKERRAIPVFPFKGGREYRWKGRATTELLDNKLIARGPGGEISIELPAGSPHGGMVGDQAGIRTWGSRP